MYITIGVWFTFSICMRLHLILHHMLAIAITSSSASAAEHLRATSYLFLSPNRTKNEIDIFVWSINFHNFNLCKHRFAKCNMLKFYFVCFRHFGINVTNFKFKSVPMFILVFFFRSKYLKCLLRFIQLLTFYVNCIELPLSTISANRAFGSWFNCHSVVAGVSPIYIKKSHKFLLKLQIYDSIDNLFVCTIWFQMNCELSILGISRKFGGKCGHTFVARLQIQLGQRWKCHHHSHQNVIDLSKSTFENLCMRKCTNERLLP